MINLVIIYIFFENRHQQLQHDTGRQSVMSECNTNNPSSSPGLSTNATLAPSSGGYGGRRASDPVRVLDRNFGVGGPHHIQSRHRSGSYAGGQQQHAENNHNYQVCAKLISIELLISIKSF